MHIHAKLPTLTQLIATPQPQRPRAAASGPERIDRVNQAKDRDTSGQPRQNQSPPRQDRDQPADTGPHRNPAVSLAAALVALSLASED